MRSWKVELFLAALGTLIVATQFWVSFSHIAACLHLGGVFGECSGTGASFEGLFYGVFVLLLAILFICVTCIYAIRFKQFGKLNSIKFLSPILFALLLVMAPPYLLSKIDFSFLTKGTPLEFKSYNSSNKDAIHYITDCSDYQTGNSDCIKDFLAKTGSKQTACEFTFGEDKSRCWWYYMHDVTGFADITPDMCVQRIYSAHFRVPQSVYLENCLTSVAKQRNDVSVCNTLLETSISMYAIKGETSNQFKARANQRCVSNFYDPKW